MEDLEQSSLEEKVDIGNLVLFPLDSYVNKETEEANLKIKDEPSKIKTMNCTKPSSPYIALLLIVLCVALIELPKGQTKIISMQEKQEKTMASDRVCAELLEEFEKEKPHKPKKKSTKKKDASPTEAEDHAVKKEPEAADAPPAVESVAPTPTPKAKGFKI